jgi:UDP-N-acetylmuramoyl-tripeptide--D-alanyl-D-alanine ligase
MRLGSQEIARLVGGTLHGDDVVVDGAAIDSRELVPGQLFVAVRAERDGHDFIEQAIDAGAAAHLTEQPPRSEPAIAVEDTQQALWSLAKALRPQLGERVVGITGSVGKTTVKDLLAAALATTYPTTASRRSHNNELGVPLTLLNAPEGTEATVVEMGARGIGHIAALCDIATPTIGLVTTVGLAHTELFGGLDAIVVAKRELVECLPASGTAVLNADVASVAAMAAHTAARVLTFGLDAGAEVSAERIVLDADLCSAFRLRSPWGDAQVHLRVAGEHQVSNALAAAAAALASGVEAEAVADGLGEARLSPWRMALHRRADGAVILNDAYNANPTSMAAALRALAGLEAVRRVAVLGEMAELGAHHDEAHAEAAALAGALGVEVVAVAAPAYGPTARHVADIDEVREVLDGSLAGTAVLLKASRLVGLERLAAELT